MGLSLFEAKFAQQAGDPSNRLIRFAFRARFVDKWSFLSCVSGFDFFRDKSIDWGSDELVYRKFQSTDNVVLIREVFLTRERREASKRETPTWWCRAFWPLSAPSSSCCCWSSAGPPAADRAMIDPRSAAKSNRRISRWSAGVCWEERPPLCSWNTNSNWCRTQCCGKCCVI